MQANLRQTAVEAEARYTQPTGQPIDYLRLTLTARVYDAARETELEPAPNLSARIGNTVLLKREDNQPVFSFKLRGAYNKMAHLSP
uniref:pyridoxal-phosphate dependent enzyme n=1 Tax=Paraburkholderia sp. TaxID=1926495 RepID=UPI00286F3E24